MRRYLVPLLAGVALATVGAVFAGFVVNSILQYDACVAAQKGIGPNVPLRPPGCLMPAPTGVEFTITAFVGAAVLLLVGFVLRSKRGSRIEQEHGPQVLA